MYMLVLVIRLPDQYMTIHCKSTNKSSVCHKWYHTYHNSLYSLNHFIDKFTNTYFSVLIAQYYGHVNVRNENIIIFLFSFC